MPNTPRERLAAIRDSIGWQVDSAGQHGGRDDSDIRQQVMNLCDLLLDSGLLDQAGHEGSGEARSEQGVPRASGIEPVTDPATVPQPPSPAPASVEGEVVTPQERAIIYRLGEVWNLYVELPVEHPNEAQEFCAAIHACQSIVGARAAFRITRLDPEAT